jgi:hypothetical protein
MTEKAAKEQRIVRKSIDYSKIPKTRGLIAQLGIKSVFVTVKKGLQKQEGEKFPPQSFFLPLIIAQKFNIENGHIVTTREEYDKLIYAS